MKDIDLVFNKDGRIAYKGNFNFNTRRFEINFSDDDLKQLIQDCSTLFNCNSTNGKTYSEGKTYFIKSDEKPRCLPEKLAQDIFLAHSQNIFEYDKKRSGAEFWSQVIDSDDHIGLHWDRDYGLEDSHGVSIHPHLATVTYLSDVGSSTAILNYRGKLYPDDSFPSEITDTLILSKPVAKKHISFDGSLLHGTLDGDHCKIHAKTKHLKRITFLVNIWINHKPIETSRCPVSLVRCLNIHCGDSKFDISETFLEETVLKIVEIEKNSQDIHQTFKADDKVYKLSLPNWSLLLSNAQGILELDMFKLLYLHKRISLLIDNTKKRKR